MSIFQQINKILFVNSSLRQTVFKNTFWLTSAQIVNRALRAVIIIYAARILGANSYGALSYTLSLIGLFAIFSDIGLTTLLTREESREGFKQEGYLRACLFLKLVLVCVSMALVAIVGPLITKIPEAQVLLPIAVFLLAFDSIREFLFALVRARQKMEIEASISIFSNIVLVFLALVVLFIFPSSKNLLISYMVSSAMALGIIVFATRKILKEASNPSKTSISKVMQAAWPFALLGILSGIMASTDTLMLGILKEAHDVGFYGAAQRPLMFLYSLPGLFATSLLPMFSKYAHYDKTRFKNILELSLSLSLGVALPIVIGGLIVAEKLILLMYGSEFVSSVQAFSILLLTLPLVFPAFIIGDAIVSYNRQKTLFIFSAIGAVSDIILNTILIPKYGILGAAFSTVGAQAFVSFFIWYKLKGLTEFSVFSRLLRIIIATTVMGVITFILDQYGAPVLITIPFSALIYLLLLYALREPLLKEVKYIFTNP